MGRPLLHQPDAILDAARDLVATGGRKAATVGAIARASRAPSGSIYHRFGSQDRVLIEAWVRAVRRFQAGFLEAIGQRGVPAAEAAVAAALWTPRFASENPADAVLLIRYRSEDLARFPLTDLDAADDVAALNDPVIDAIRRLAVRLYGRIGRRGYETLTLAVVDLPYGAVRRHLGRRHPGRGGVELPSELPAQLEAAVRAALAAGPRPRRRRPAGS